ELNSLLTQAGSLLGVPITPHHGHTTWAGPTTISSQNCLVLQHSMTMQTPAFLLPNALLTYEGGTYQGNALVNILPSQPESYPQVHVNMINMRKLPMGPVSSPYALRPRPPPLISLRVLIGRLHIPFLLDTGAQADCIRTDVFQALGGTLLNLPYRAKLYNANGHPLACRGIWRTTVMFGNITSTVDLHVIDNLTANGILGQPWQRANCMWLRHFSDGTLIGVQSQDGCRTYELLITAPEARRAAWGHIGQLDTATQEVEDGEIVELSGDESPEVEETLPDETLGTGTMSTQTMGTNLELYIPSQDPWDVDFESRHEDGPGPGLIQSRMYRNLLLKYLVDHKLDHQEENTHVELPEVLGADRFALTDAWKVNPAGNEDLLLLKNILVKVDGQYREGHAAMHIQYFPHTTDRVIEAARNEEAAAQKSTETLVLSSDEESPLHAPRAHPVFPRWTQADIEDFMEELEDYETGAHAQRWRLSWGQESNQSDMANHSDQERPFEHTCNSNGCDQDYSMEGNSSGNTSTSD
ncbi:hypothetical protein C2E23DRAFT_686196, partial [Lenzites betulinus]